MPDCKNIFGCGCGLDVVFVQADLDYPKLLENFQLFKIAF